MSEQPEGAAAPERFDATKYLVNLNGKGEYLEVKWRLVWLRAEHPDAQIETELIKLEPNAAVFKATITIPGKGAASGFGSETAGDFRDFLEKAETKAIGRACAALGYGTQFCQDHEISGGTTSNTGQSDRPAARQQQQQQRQAPPPNPTAQAKPAAPPPDKAATRKRMEEQAADDALGVGKRVAAAVWLIKNASNAADLATVITGIQGMQLDNPAIDKAIADARAN